MIIYTQLATRIRKSPGHGALYTQCYSDMWQHRRHRHRHTVCSTKTCLIIASMSRRPCPMQPAVPLTSGNHVIVAPGWTGRDYSYFVTPVVSCPVTPSAGRRVFDGTTLSRSVHKRHTLSSLRLLVRRRVKSRMSTARGEQPEGKRHQICADWCMSGRRQGFRFTVE